MEKYENNKTENITGTNQKEKQDHYQKYRGYSLKILEQLENSGGMTTRAISDAILGNARVISVTIQRLVRRCVIDRVENWGWKININGLKVLSIFNKKNITTNNNNNNTTTTQQQHDVNMKDDKKAEEQKSESPEWIPSCFYRTSCNIRSIMKKSVYDSKTSNKCEFCVSRNTHEYFTNMAGKFLGVI